jgi:serine/threonine protein phosphatase 1
MSRTIAIGDIHGCSDALASLLSAIKPQSSDTIIPLGDYVDKGHDSRGVLDMLIDLGRRCRLIPLLGNHDEQMLSARYDKAAFDWWMEFGGIETLGSYGDSEKISLVPEEHFEFLESCVPYFKTKTHFFTHGNYDPALPLDRQEGETLRWLSLRDFLPGPHFSSKIAVVGHTPQPEVLNLGCLICLDTGCAYGGTLTAMDVISGGIWQASS